MKCIEYVRVRCPECGDKWTAVYETFRISEIGLKERWHRCYACGKTFRSLEKIKTQGLAQ